MTEAELLLALSTKFFNQTEDELKPLIYGEGETVLDNAFDAIAALDTARIKRLKDEQTKKYNDGHGKGKAETATEIEKYYRELFNVADEGNYEVIATAIKEQLSKKPVGKEITEDDIKKHPVYLNLEKNYVPKDIHEALVTEHTQFKTGIDRRIKIDNAKKRALYDLESFKPDYTPYSDTPIIKQTLTDTYLREIESVDDIEFDEKGEIIAVIKDGKRVEDGHGNVKPFSDFTKEIAGKYFKFLKQDPKGGAGNGTPAGNPHATSYVFKDRDDAVKQYTDAKNAGATPEVLKGMIAAIDSMNK